MFSLLFWLIEAFLPIEAFGTHMRGAVEIASFSVDMCNLLRRSVERLSLAGVMNRCKGSGLQNASDEG